MRHDLRPFRERYAEAAGALSRRRAIRIVALFALFVLLAIVFGALVAPQADAAFTR